MAEGIKNIGNIVSHTYRSQNADGKRAMAIAAALELIALNVTNAGNGGLLENELNSLSAYADKIQAALEGK